MRYVIDFDGTLFELSKDLDMDAKPIVKNINKVNELHANGHTITIYTSRGMLSAGSKEAAEKKYYKIVSQLLSKHMVNYDELVFGKLSADVYVDDLCLHSNTFSKRINVLYGKFGREINFEKFGAQGGHYEAIGQIKILSQFCNVYLFGDIKGDIPFDNVQHFIYSKHSDGIDLVFLDNGVTNQSPLAKDVNEKILKNSEIMLYFIEKLKRPVIYSLTDPRLKFDHPLFIEFSQNDKENTLHQDKLCLLSLPFIDNEKEFKCIVVGMDDGRGKLYDELISDIREKFCDVDVYGNLKLEKNKDCLRGMIPADKIGEYYSKYTHSFMIPIEKGWITQKYCESIHFGCVPITFAYDDNSIFFETDYEYAIDVVELPEFERDIIDEMKVKLLPFYRMETWVDLYSKKIDEVLKNEKF